MKNQDESFKLVLASMAREGCTFRGVDGATMLAVAPDGSNRATVRYKLDGNRKRSAAIEMPHKDIECVVEKRRTFADDAVGAVCEALTRLDRGTMTGAGLRAASPLFDAICKEADELETPRVAERLRALAAAGATFTLAGFGRLVAARPGKGAYDALASLSAGCTMAVLEERGENASTITKSVAASDRDALGALIDALADGPLDGGAALAVLGGEDVCTPCVPGDEPDAVYDPVVKALKDVMDEGSRFIYVKAGIVVAIGEAAPKGAPHRAVFIAEHDGSATRAGATARVAVADRTSPHGWRYDVFCSNSPDAVAVVCDVAGTLKGDAR